MGAAATDTLERVRVLVIKELKLGEGAVVADDMPLLGGMYDLDSLDVLLLVTAVERHFEIKIPNESIGREAFSSVGALAEFVDRQRAGVA